MPLRNPFGRRSNTSVSLVQDENVPPSDPSTRNGNGASNPPKFERVDTVGSKASSILSIKTPRRQDTGEYKMSVVNDSGVYLPPSPTENPERSPWSRRYHASRTSCEISNSNGDIEAFSISRESFDSYRRSFDICAKSPIVNHQIPARQSLDSARLPRPPRSSHLGRNRNGGSRQPATEEEESDASFEDVRLDEPASSSSHPAASSRRRGLFGMFSENQEPASNAQPTVSRFLPGRRRRGHSGQGAELGSMERPGSRGEIEQVA